MFREKIAKASTMVVTIDRKEATDWRHMWDNMVTSYNNGMKLYLCLQKNIIDMLRIIIT